MAEIISNNLAETRHTLSQQRALSLGKIKIDMTPMVDLGFLLITFFIFTTEISKPTVTNLYMPHDGDSTGIAASRSVTFLLGAYNRVFYYFGSMQQAINSRLILETSYDELTGLGSIVRKKQKDLETNLVDRKQLVVLIKPCRDASYKNVVDALDEMLINDVMRYSLSDPEPWEAVYSNR